MISLRKQHWQRLQEALGQLDNADGVFALARRALSAVRYLIDADGAVFAFRRRADRHYFAFCDPEDFPVDRYKDAYEAYCSEHPIMERVAELVGGPAVRLSDVVGALELRRRHIYHEVFRPLGICRLVASVRTLDEAEALDFGTAPGCYDAVPVSAPRTGHMLVAVSACRTSGRDFSATELVMFNLFVQQTELLLRREIRAEIARRNLEGAVGALGDARMGLLLTDRHGLVREISPIAASILREEFGRAPGAGQPLPESVVTWFDRLATARERETDATLQVHVGLGEGTAGRVIILRRRQPRGGSLAAALGVTPREAEVLRWLARGKTNPEIGTILGISPRTVEKHLEAVFQKIGVETRTAAMLRVLEVTGLGDAG